MTAAKSILSFLFILVLSYAHAQSNIIYGSYWNGSQEIFSAFDTDLGTKTDLGILNGVQTLSLGESAIDPIGNRYFIVTNLGLTVVNYRSGAIINTFPLTAFIKGLEFDPGSGLIYGSYWNGSQEIFAGVNPTTGVLNDIAILSGVQTLSVGESSLDPLNGRYFNVTNLGLMTIDVQTGAVLNVVSNNIGMKGIEFDPITQLLYGSRWTGSQELFMTMEPISGLFTTGAPFIGVQTLAVGESSLDPVRGLYFRSTNLGLTVVDISTGLVSSSYSNSGNLKGYEFPYCVNSSVPLSTSSASSCSSDSVLLSITGDYNNYLWNNGRNTSSIYVNDSAQYSVIAIDSFGCATPSTPLSINIFDCNNGLDSATSILDTCAIDSIPVAMAYVDDLNIHTDSFDLAWNLLMSSGDTLNFQSSYNLSQSGLHAVSLELNCATNSKSSSFTDIIEVNRIISNLGLQEAQTNYTLFPNPSTGSFSINSKSNLEIERMEIIDLSGQLIYSDASDIGSSKTYNLDLNPGLYTIRLTNNIQTEILKLIID